MNILVCMAFGSRPIHKLMVQVLLRSENYILMGIILRLLNTSVYF